MEYYNLLSLTNKLKAIETAKQVEEVPEEEHDHDCGCIFSDEIQLPNVDAYDCFIKQNRRANITDFLSAKTINHLSNYTNYVEKFGDIVSKTNYRALETSGVMEVQQVIFFLHHGNFETIISGLPSGSGGKASDDYLPGGLNDPNAPEHENEEGKKTFIENVYNVDDLFKKMAEMSSGFDSKYQITYDETNKENNKVSREQLIYLIHACEDFEDSNYDFFGSINRVFYYLDTLQGNKDGFISYSEMKNLIDDEVGILKDYSARVREFNNKIQVYYEGLSDQNKFEFVVERVREYFEAVGFTKQLEALNRLYNSTEDTHNSGGIGKGQMWMYTPSNPKEGGAYGADWSWYGYENGVTGGKPDYSFVYRSDADTSSGDYGLNLSTRLLNGQWYNLVDVMVHELTHATAWLYYPTSGTDYSDQVNYLFSKGVIDQAEKDFYIANMTEIAEDIERLKNKQAAVHNIKITEAANSAHKNESAHLRLLYLITCQYTEYMAYQVDDDYMDSVAGDVYMEAGAKSGVIAKGDMEATKIKEWINKNYDPQISGMKVALPDYDDFYSYNNLDKFRSYFA